jgi:hypothetical protein
VNEALSLIPDDINVALVGSNISEVEEEWLRQNVNRPFHNIRVDIDDKTVWEFLFKTNLHNFGWIDADCFVLNPDVLREIKVVADDAAINCVWYYSLGSDLEILRTHLLFINADVIRILNQKGLTTSPCTYNYEGTNEGRHLLNARCKIPNRKQTELLRKMMPTDDRNRPLYPSFEDGRGQFVSEGCFDTLILYQLTANSLGYRLRKIRDLNVDRPENWTTDELIHVGSISYYKRFKFSTDLHSQRIYRMVSQVEFLLLHKSVSLPESYHSMRGELEEDLERIGISADALKKQYRDSIASGRGKHIVLDVIRELNQDIFNQV